MNLSQFHLVQYLGETERDAPPSTYAIVEFCGRR
jgi:hypothetical protein